MRPALFGFILTLLMIFAAKFAQAGDSDVLLPPIGTQIGKSGDKYPAPFSYQVCEKALTSRHGKKLQTLFDPRIVLDKPTVAASLKNSVWALFNMSPASMRSPWWHVEFARSPENNTMLFRIVRANGSIAYQRSVAQPAMINNLLDEGAQLWALKGPYVELEIRKDVRILLFVDEFMDNETRYTLSVEVPCQDLLNYMKLPNMDGLTDNSQVVRGNGIFCRFQVMDMEPHHIVPLPWWLDRAAAKKDSETYGPHMWDL